MSMLRKISRNNMQLSKGKLSQEYRKVLGEAISFANTIKLIREVALIRGPLSFDDINAIIEDYEFWREWVEDAKREAKKESIDVDDREDAARAATPPPAEGTGPVTAPPLVEGAPV